MKDRRRDLLGATQQVARLSIQGLAQNTVFLERHHLCFLSSPLLLRGIDIMHTQGDKFSFLLLHGLLCDGDTWAHLVGPLSRLGRSEEHTSELQSLMRIS